MGMPTHAPPAPPPPPDGVKESVFAVPRPPAHTMIASPAAGDIQPVRSTVRVVDVASFVDDAALKAKVT